MRVVLCFFILVLLSSNILGQGKAKIEFKEIQHDYGTINQDDDPLPYTFRFKNTGSVPLIITNVRSSCNCTSPEWDRNPIMPGKEGNIKIAFIPKSNPGTFNKTIRVSSNAENSSATLRIKGYVVPNQESVKKLYREEIASLRVKSKRVSIGKQLNTEIKSKTIELFNDSEKEMKVEVKKAPSCIITSINPSIIKPHERAYLKISYDASKNNLYGFVWEKIYLSTNNKIDYRNELTISTTINEDFSTLSEADLKNAPVAEFKESGYDFGNIKPKEKVKHTFVIKNSGKRDLIIRRIKSSCDCIIPSIEKNIIGANESIPLKVTFDPNGRKGRQFKSITITTNDPKNPTKFLKINSNVID